MRSLVVFALLCGCIHIAAASPRFKKDRSASVDLELRPSNVERTNGALDVRPAPATSDPKGGYMGPVFLEGSRYAGTLKKIPAKLRKGMGQPVGPEPMVFFRGGGAGLYARF